MRRLTRQAILGERYLFLQYNVTRFSSNIICSSPENEFIGGMRLEHLFSNVLSIEKWPKLENCSSL